MCFSSVCGTFALPSICCWWLPDYLHGLPGASQLLTVVAQSNHWWVDSFASFSCPSFDHSALLTAMAWENRDCMYRAMLTLTLFWYIHRKSKWTIGPPHLGSGLCPGATEASEEGSLWNPKLLRNNFMCHPICHLYAKCFYMPLLGLIVHLWVCVHLWVFNTTHRWAIQRGHPCDKRCYGITEGEVGLFSS